MKNPQVVLITGTSRGMGKAFADDLRNQGYVVYGTSRAGDESDEKHLALEVTDAESCQAAVDEVILQQGRLNILINNAGHHLTAASEEASLEEIHQQIDVNFWGVVNMIKAVTPHMLRQKQGKIITMSSFPGHVAVPFTSAYCASKFAVEGYTGSLRLELLPFGLYVSNIVPGAVKTGTQDQSLRVSQTSHKLFEKYRAALHEQIENQQVKGSSRVEDVVAVLRKIVKAKKPAFCYPVGDLTKQVFFLKRLLPTGMLEGQLLKLAGLPRKVSY